MDISNSALSRLNRRLKGCFHRDATLRDFIDEDYFWSGQGFRGKLSIEVGSCFDIDEDILLEIALFSELLHNASLVHDDIVDQDSERRGRKSIWKKYGTDKAILLGDLLIAKAFEVASCARVANSVKVHWLSTLSKTVTEAVRGALNELEFNFSDDDEVLSRYHRMADQKTGVMFTLPIRCLGHAAGMSLKEIESLSGMFSKLAVAYQIRDDHADFFGLKKGRVSSSDIMNGRPNLYHLLSTSSDHSLDFVDYVSNFQENLINRAMDELTKFPSPLSDVVNELVLPFVRLKAVPDSYSSLAQST